MNTTLLTQLFALMVGVFALPRTPLLEERPVPALILIPEGQLISLQSYALPFDDNYQQSDEEIIPVGENTAKLLEEINEHPRGAEPLEEEDPNSGHRSKRSTQPGGGGVPSPQQGGGGSDRGRVDVGVSRGEGGGRRVEASGEGNVWRSRDGRGRVDVHGHYSRDFGGRHGTGRPQYGGGVRYSHRF